MSDTLPLDLIADVTLLIRHAVPYRVMFAVSAAERLSDVFDAVAMATLRGAPLPLAPAPFGEGDPTLAAVRRAQYLLAEEGREERRALSSLLADAMQVRPQLLNLADASLYARVSAETILSAYWSGELAGALFREEETPSFWTFDLDRYTPLSSPRRPLDAQDRALTLLARAGFSLVTIARVSPRHTTPNKVAVRLAFLRAAGLTIPEVPFVNPLASGSLDTTAARRVLARTADEELLYPFDLSAIVSDDPALPVIRRARAHVALPSPVAAGASGAPHRGYTRLVSDETVIEAWQRMRDGATFPSLAPLLGSLTRQGFHARRARLGLPAPREGRVAHPRMRDARAERVAALTRAGYLNAADTAAELGLRPTVPSHLRIAGMMDAESDGVTFWYSPAERARYRRFHRRENEADSAQGGDETRAALAVDGSPLHPTKWYAARDDLSVKTINVAISNGELTPVRVGSAVRISESEFARWRADVGRSFVRTPLQVSEADARRAYDTCVLGYPYRDTDLAATVSPLTFHVLVRRYGWPPVHVARRERQNRLTPIPEDLRGVRRFLPHIRVVYDRLRAGEPWDRVSPDSPLPRSTLIRLFIAWHWPIPEGFVPPETAVAAARLVARAAAGEDAALLLGADRVVEELARRDAASRGLPFPESPLTVRRSGKPRKGKDAEEDEKD